MKIGKFGTKFLYGAFTALGSITVREGYRQYLHYNPIDKMFKEKERKKKFDYIMSQTNLKDELA